MPALRPTAAANRRRLVALLAATTLVLGVAPVASAGPGPRARLLALVNASRERHDLRLLKLNRPLSADAERHTRRMLRKDRIFDPPNLEEILAPYPYDDLGAAAVGCAETLNALHHALMDSEVHHDILLHPKLRKAGIGVIRTDEGNLCGRGSFWVTELFYG